MTDNEIIKALECCTPSYTKKCIECVYEQYKSTVLGKTLCSEYMRKDALDLINRQKAVIEHWQGGYMTQKQEIANLEIELKAMRGSANSYKAEVERLKTEKDNLIRTYAECQAEAVKEFAERLKEKENCEEIILEDGDEIFYTYVTIEDIDNLLKETVGDAK